MIEPVRSLEDLKAINDLFHEYVAWLAVDHATHGVEIELANLQGVYGQPAGELYLAKSEDGSPQGCIGVRPLTKPGACEIKRLYVREAARKSGLGRALTEIGIAFAKSAGYSEVYCDSLPRLTAAIAIFRSMGFEQIAPYYENLVPGAVFLRKRLELRSS